MFITSFCIKPSSTSFSYTNSQSLAIATQYLFYYCHAVDISKSNGVMIPSKLYQSFWLSNHHWLPHHDMSQVKPQWPQSLFFTSKVGKRKGSRDQTTNRITASLTTLPLVLLLIQISILFFLVF